MANFPIPKGYQRMGAFPLDATTVFATLAALEAYAAVNATAYPGQICSVVDGGVYKIKTDKSLVEIGAINTNLDYGEFPL